MAGIIEEYDIVKRIRSLASSSAVKDSIVETVGALMLACQKAQAYFDECVHSCDDEDAPEAVLIHRALMLSKGIDLPINAVIMCPECEEQHVDAPDEQCEHTLQLYCSDRCVLAKGHDGKHLTSSDDIPESRRRWTNPPHAKHLCHGCGHLWKPFPFATFGVKCTGGEAHAGAVSGGICHSEEGSDARSKISL
jgi:hypothetical protein